MLGLYNIKIYKGKEKVYDENLGFARVEPNKEDIIGFIKLIQPEFLSLDKNFAFEKIECNFIRPLKPAEL